ncbi:MAG: helix-turn-helix domain-containing protein [Flavobacteriaceae bacterium]|nr:helix-turn-helix domain-containing protein [Flavobacteriaceae bacterium]
MIVIIVFLIIMSFLNTFFRCDCPVTSALDVIGDKWTLVVVKLMLLEQKKTFKEFSESDESIAPSILSNRLKMLEKMGFIVKEKLPDNQKTNHYFLTEKGLSLTPVVIELALWSHNNIKPYDNQDIVNVKDKNELHLAVIERYKSKTVTLE